MVFVDLAGSTAAYATFDNAQVADFIGQVTQWIGRVCEAHGGRVVKYLGDGVLARFPTASGAVEACTFMQQSHAGRLRQWPEPLRMGLKIGIAEGDIVVRDQDVYGDAVNLAARLSDMAGPGIIWADESALAELRQEISGQQSGMAAAESGSAATPAAALRYRSLGMIRVRGLTQAHSVFQIEWSEDATTDLMTVRGVLHDLRDEGDEASGGSLALSWLGKASVFEPADMPVTLGRIPTSSFVVSDQRVSRSHAQVERINGALMLSDISSFGTWVRFADDPNSEVHLRRTQCALHSTGEIALGAPFSDFSAPVVAFRVGVKE